MLKFNFIEGDSTKSFETYTDQLMQEGMQHFEKELVKIRTGRAHTSMVEDIRVPAYGNFMPLKEVASLSAPEAALIVIQPWDKSLIDDIDKAISTSDLGVTPLNDGDLIRIQLPKMSSTRRDELAKMLAKKAEECKVSIRNIRRDVVQLIKDTEKTKKISEDYSKRLQDLTQKITDKFTALADNLTTKKEAEIKAL